ncbi:uncharacterized protein CLUP02_17164 [Colletotrichum lupini]|uniref:Uncharacterized protein n=1 Tax=Colletotrichum lupini TaxID=145971 RepID=A0A9Q8WPW5_9PEZI|nr:uncharacterized protein CLUP02_17164 [Colletotrichum lupini]UQC91628.1 hypothetical protein CLUP02_17164 [Colletotrichum lupini]
MPFIGRPNSICSFPKQWTNFPPSFLSIPCPSIPALPISVPSHPLPRLTSRSIHHQSSPVTFAFTFTVTRCLHLPSYPLLFVILLPPSYRPRALVSFIFSSPPIHPNSAPSHTPRSKRLHLSKWQVLAPLTAPSSIFDHHHTDRRGVPHLCIWDLDLIHFHSISAWQLILTGTEQVSVRTIHTGNPNRQTSLTCHLHNSTHDRTSRYHRRTCLRCLPTNAKVPFILTTTHRARPHHLFSLCLLSTLHLTIPFVSESSSSPIARTLCGILLYRSPPCCRCKGYRIRLQALVKSSTLTK